MRLISVMTRLFVLGACTVAPAVVAAPRLAAQVVDQYHPVPKDTVSPAVYNGWKQFQLNCARCHGEEATGTTFAPNLVHSLGPDGTITSQALFVVTVCQGRPDKGMPGWCALELPMPVILIGAIGGMVTGGIIGLFIGPVALAVSYKLFWQWVDQQVPPAADGVQPPN